MSAIKEELHAAVEGLTDEQANRLLNVVRGLRVGGEEERDGALLDALRAIPGVTVPEHRPPQFRDVEPVPAAGKPASEILIGDRR